MLAGIWLVQSVLAETGMMPNGLGPLSNATGILGLVVGAIGLGFVLLAVAPTSGFGTRLARLAYVLLGVTILLLELALARSNQPGVVAEEEWSGLVIYASLPAIAVGLVLLVLAYVLHRRSLKAASPAA